MSKMNRMANAHNQFQSFEKYPRVLCVCSAGLLRSPTVAWILSNEPFNFNTRAAGANGEYGLVQVDEALVFWADYVVFMENGHFKMVDDRYHQFLSKKKTVVLDLPDDFGYRDPQLVELATAKLKDYFDK